MARLDPVWFDGMVTMITRSIYAFFDSCWDYAVGISGYCRWYDNKYAFGPKIPGFTTRRYPFYPLGSLLLQKNASRTSRIPSFPYWTSAKTPILMI